MDETAMSIMLLWEWGWGVTTERAIVDRKGGERVGGDKEEFK